MERSDVIRAVSDSVFFQNMVEEDRLDLARVGRLHEHGHGDVLFRPREIPNALYLVVEGVAEINRRDGPDGEFEPVAYVGAGAALAASKVITGTPFESLARFPEGGETLQWPRPLVLRRIFESGSFSMQYLQNLARRLEGGFAHGDGRGSTKLGGRIDHFDLPTILQTVVDSGANGVLRVADAHGRTFGTIYTEHRQIGPMSCGGLCGPEAFFEILISPPERGTFAFSNLPRPDPTERLYDLRPLLLEAATLQDEFIRFRSEVPGDAPLRLLGLQLQWCDAEDLDLIEQIWNALAARPEGWETLAARLPYSRSQVALAVRDLVQIGEVAVDVGEEIAPGAR
jgi:CRP-like cAMP-binding protein